MADSDKVVIRRLKKKKITLQEQYNENFEEWVAYWRANPQRFIAEYLGLPLYDFQKFLIWEMFTYVFSKISIRNKYYFISFKIIHYF